MKWKSERFYFIKVLFCIDRKQDQSQDQQDTSPGWCGACVEYLKASDLPRREKGCPLRVIVTTLRSSECEAQCCTKIDARICSCKALHLSCKVTSVLHRSLASGPLNLATKISRTFFSCSMLEQHAFLQNSLHIYWWYLNKFSLSCFQTTLNFTLILN